jgi:hypothetical protein
MAPPAPAGYATPTAPLKPVNLPPLPPREIPLERIVWLPLDLLVTVTISGSFFLGLMAAVGFNPVSVPLFGFFLGMGAALVGSLYYAGVWGINCPFCKQLTTDETGRCARCLAPLEGDPASMSWEPPPWARRDAVGPGPFGDRGTFERARMRWKGNYKAFARENSLFAIEALTVGLVLDSALFDLAFAPGGGANVMLVLFTAAVGTGLFRPALHRRAKRAIQKARQTKSSREA